jgi:hypothetical protein
MKEHVERRDGSQVNVDLEMIAATGGNRRGVVGLTEDAYPREELIQTQ